MNTVLVTGATSFLGYHVAKRLNEQGVRPRAIELAGQHTKPIGADVERCASSLADPRAIEHACRGVDTIVHTAFKVSVGGGAALIDEMRRVNVGGTRELLEIAAASGVSRVVITGSALAVGVNRQPQPLDESADWSEHGFDFPYATIRREAERDAFTHARPGFSVVSVCPSFTLGPDDPVGAPANALVKAVITRKLPVTLPVGFGCLDVRDFAAGAVLAAERGTSGRRYLLSGENLMASDFLQQAAAIAGVRAPRFGPPKFLLTLGVAGIEAVSALRRRPPPVTRSVLQIIGRYAWYDTTRARTELGWAPRPLRQTLEDTIQWLRAAPVSGRSRTAP